MSYRPTCFIYRYDRFPLNPSYVHLTTASFPRDFNKKKGRMQRKNEQHSVSKRFILFINWVFVTLIVQNVQRTVRQAKSLLLPPS